MRCETSGDAFRFLLVYSSQEKAKRLGAVTKAIHSTVGGLWRALLPFVGCVRWVDGPLSKVNYPVEASDSSAVITNAQLSAAFPAIEEVFTRRL